jgi:hypothetical protein
MSKNIRLLLPTSVLVLTILACSVQTVAPSVPSVPDVGAVGTAAALTVAAKVGGAVVPSTSVPVPATPATPTASPVPPTDTSVPSATPICDRAKFVSETIPDGTVYPPNAVFTKSWRLRNTGACTWNSSYALVFDSGTAMNAPSSVPLPGNVAPGQEVDLSVNMQAPGSPGTYTGYWKLRNASSVLFGVEPSGGPFWVKIVVVAPTATPTATPTSSGLHIIGTLLIPHIPLALAPSTQQVYAQVTAPAGGIGHATVACPSGTLITGGGFAGNTNLFVYNTSVDGNGWQVYAKNTSGSVQLLNSYAICLSNSSGSTQQVYAQTTAPAGGIGHTTVACPAGSVVTGGGYAGNTNLFVYNSSADGNGWEVYAQNTSGSSQLLNAYAICLSGTSATSQQLYNQVTAPASGIGHAVKACPSGSVLTGGGFAGNTNLFVYNTSASGNSWEAYAKNTSGSGQLLNAYVSCTTFP